MYILKINRTARISYKFFLKSIRVHIGKIEYVRVSKVVFSLGSCLK